MKRAIRTSASKAALVFEFGRCGLLALVTGWSFVTTTSAAGPIVSVSVSAPRLVLGLQENQVLTATIRDSSGAIVTDHPVAWASSNNTIAQVNATGLVTPIGEGQATISASVDGQSGSATLEIVWGAADVDLSKSVTVKSLSGLLHGLSFRHDVDPPDQIIEPLALKYWRSTDNVVPVARAHGFGARYDVLLSDYWGYPPWPNGKPWVNNAAYASMMEAVARKLQGQADIWEIWNEPDQNFNQDFWDGTEQQFFDIYLQTYKILRRILGPTAIIAGPSIKTWDEGFLDRFASFCIANGCEANVLTWHENGNTVPVQDIALHVRRARARYITDPVNAALNVHEIHINEAIGPGQTHSPAASLLYLQYMEIGGADAAARSCWSDSTGGSECFNNSLDGLITPAGFSPRSVWWAHRLYAQGVAGRVAGQSARSQMLVLASVVAGSPSTIPITLSGQILTGFGDVDGVPANATLGIRITGVDALPGMQGATAMTVRIYEVPISGEAAAPAPTLLSTQIVNLNDGAATLLVRAAAKDSVFQIALAPAGNISAYNYQGLWWAAPSNSESGWGINFAHQADTIFATWYTYDASGEAWWLSMTANKVGEGTYAGTLLRTTGPAFNAIPFDPDKVTRTPVGTGTLTFSDTLTGQFAYTVEGIPQTKPITRQVFGPPAPCVWSAQPNLAAATNYQDLWWVANGAESGWGVNLTHQGDIIFATWFTYDFDGSVLWLSATAAKGGNGVYTGTLYRTTGPAFYAQPFDPNRVTRTPVGRLTITFADGNTGTFAYTVYGITQRKTITRQVFYPPAGTVCSTVVRYPISVTAHSPTASPWVGEQVQLTANVPDLGGYPITDQPVTWSSSDPRVATISATGTLQALATGSVVITATVGGVSGSQALTIVPMPRISVSVGATKEVVYRWATDRCNDQDTPDLPTHIVRAEDGSLVLFAGNAPRFYASRGADFGSLKRDCSQPVLVSADLPTPQSYENREWISAVYREGSRWHAIISNEYHDLVASTCRSSDPSIYIDCLYLSATYAMSTDGARTFTKPTPPAHVVLPPPYVWEPPLPGAPFNWEIGFHEGYNAPYSLVRKDDGYFYAIVGLTPSKSVPYAGQCLLRTDRIDDPTSWRAWDGAGFNDHLASPYMTGYPAPLCKVSGSVAGVGGLLTFNTYFNRYMDLDIWHSTVDGKMFCSFVFRLSADLVHWSAPQLITEPGDLGFCPPDSQGLTYNVMYPTLIDHADATINFERPGRTPYVYYVRFNRKTNDSLYWADRDLVRVPLTFTRID